MEKYGDVPYVCRILVVFEANRRLSPAKKGYHRPHIKSTRETTQGELISPTLFNLIVDNVVWKWLALTVEYQLVAQVGLGLALGRCLGIFYANDAVV